VCAPSGSEEKESDGGVVVNENKVVRLNNGGLWWSEKVTDGSLREKEVMWEGEEKERGKKEREKKKRKKKLFPIPYFILHGVCSVFYILCSIIKTLFF